LSGAFSFNAEEGACPVCKGLGTITVCDAERIVTNPEKPITSGAMDGTKTGRFYGDPHGQYIAALLTAGKKYGIDYSVPFTELGERAKETALNGCGEELFEVDWKYKRGAHVGTHKLKTTWPGFLKLVETEYFRKHDDARGDAMLELMKLKECDNCHGFRLRPEILQYKIRQKNIGEVAGMTADDALIWFTDDFTGSFETELEKQAAASLRVNICKHLEALQKAGLGYISTGRTVGTLSGGEYQRLMLAGLARAPLTGVAYILDEPSFGLHPKDTGRISDLIMELNSHGNRDIMVDHSALLAEKAQLVIEMGPGSGKDGGYLINAGSAKKILSHDHESFTLLTGKGSPGAGVKITGANANNLRKIDLEIPSGIMTVITGVSGSGKTSLLNSVIFESWSSKKPQFCKDIRGFENFTDLIYIEQPVPGTGYNATVGQRLGISEAVGKIFAGTEMSKKKKYRLSHFISGSRDSRCPECEGTGSKQVSMDFFSDVISLCERCGGTGFSDEVLEIFEDGKTVFDVLQIPFDDISGFLDTRLHGNTLKNINAILELVKKTGMGHLSCSRQLKTLSTGELQRLKLVSGLSARAGSNTLFLLDEPTGGLNPSDIMKLLSLLGELIDEGDTIVCVTHEQLLLGAASAIIELGPGGGTNGGRIVMRSGE